MNPLCRPSRALLTLVAALSAGALHAGSCSVSATALAFGTYQPITFAGKLASADRTSDATVTVACTGIAQAGGYTIALGPSPHGNSFLPRYMAHGADGPPMAFNVYRDATYSAPWGDGAAGATLGGTIPTGDSQQTHPVFGRIPAGQNTLRPGSYSSTLSVTISYEP